MFNLYLYKYDIELMFFISKTSVLYYIYTDITIMLYMTLSISPRLFQLWQKIWCIFMYFPPWGKTA